MQQVRPPVDSPALVNRRTQRLDRPYLKRGGKLEPATWDEAFAAIRRSPSEFAEELRLAAAVHWYARGLVSQERAAQIAGLDRTDFLLALAREGVDAFVVDMDSLRRELAEPDGREAWSG